MTMNNNPGDPVRSGAAAAVPDPNMPAPQTAIVRIHLADLGPADHAPTADAGAVLSLLDAYARDPLGDGRPLTVEVRACLIPALRQVPGALVLLARAAEEPVGVAVCFTGFSTFRARGLLNIHDLAVLPAWRGRGIGRRLLDTVVAIARQRGYCKATLEVRADNASARALYAGLGFGAGASGAADGAVMDIAPKQYLFLERRLD